MFTIFNERKQFWQWDTGQRLIVDDDVCPEIHFCNGTDKCSLVCEPYMEDGLRLVDVPNILFQTAKTIRVYSFIRNDDETYTKQMQAFSVLPRTKPYDYVYTETEVRDYNHLRDELTKMIEDAGGVTPERVDESVKKYLDENPIEMPLMDENTVGGAKLGNHLAISETGHLSVETASDFEGDNTRPITAAAVEATVGNIEILLGTI